MKAWHWALLLVTLAAAGGGGYWWWSRQRAAEAMAAQAVTQAAAAPPRKRKKKRKGLLDVIGLGGAKGLVGGAMTAVGTVYGGPVGAALAQKAGAAVL